MGHIYGAFGKSEHTMKESEGSTLHFHDGSVNLLWDGAIYNHRALQNTLSDMGYAFQTEDPETEIIVRLYQAYGKDMANYLRGKFAIALYDAKKDVLFLWRDPYGSKPLYYRFKDETLVFSSGLKELVEQGREDVMSPAGMRCYFSYHCTVPPDTVYTDCLELPPGTRMEIRMAEERIVTEEITYYTLDFVRSLPSKDLEALEYAHSFDECDAVAELRSCLTKAVDNCLETDGQVDVLLSGGLDSSYIAALAAGIKREPLYTYTLDYQCRMKKDHEKRADVAAAETLAKRLRMFHTTYTVTGEEALKSLPDVVKAFDQPYSGGISLYWILERVPADRRVFLTGDGGDELFWGYPFHKTVYDRLYGAKYGSDQKDTSPALPGYSGGLWKLFLTDDTWHWVFGEEKGIDSLTDGQTLQSDPAAATDGHYFHRLLPGQVLRYVEALSGVWGKEIHAPFLDQRVVESAAQVPVWMKMRNGQPKYLLKRMAENVLPPEFLKRPKETFLPPLFWWFQDEWKEYILDMLSTERLEKTGLFKPEAVYLLLRRFYSAPEENRQSVELIWSVLMLQLWWDGIVC